MGKHFPDLLVCVNINRQKGGDIFRDIRYIILAYGVAACENRKRVIKVTAYGQQIAKEIVVFLRPSEAVLRLAVAGEDFDN